MAQSHVLAGAARVWDSTKSELEDKDGDSQELRDGAPVPPDEMKKVAKYLQGTVVKFGASASVEDKSEILQPIADEVIKAFTAVVGTLLSVRRGAGSCLRAELREAGSGLASSLDVLGTSVGSEAMSVNAGKVLDRVKFFEKISTHNRAAIRRRLLGSLAQLRDAQRELQETLRIPEGSVDTEPDPLSDADSMGAFEDEALEPHERSLVEATCEATTSFEELLAQVSRLCMPTPGGASPGASGPPADPRADVPIPVLEATVAHGHAAASAIDNLVHSCVGGVDVPACENSIQELRAACDGLAGAFETPPFAADAVREKLDRIKVALDEAVRVIG